MLTISCCLLQREAKVLLFKNIVPNIFFILSFGLTTAVCAQSPLDSLDCLYLEELFSKIENKHDATVLFFQALENLEKPSPKNTIRLKRLKADVTDIILENEQQQYKKLDSVSDKIAFFKRFWLLRDPTPATPENERLVEHYTRLAYARDNFASFDFRGYDDRGQIYVQYGQPDEKVVDVAASSALNFETWAYYRLGAPVTFDFVDKGHGYYFAFSLDEAIVVKSMPTTYLGGLFNLAQKRAFLTPNYLSLYLVIEDSYFDGGARSRFLEIQLQLEQAFNNFQSANHNVQVTLPKVESDIFQDLKELPFEVQLVKFNGHAQQHDLALIYGINPSDLKFDNSNTPLELITTAAVRDTNGVLLKSHIDTLQFAKETFSDLFIGAIEFAVPSGRYFVALDLSIEASKQRGLQDFSLTTGPYSTGSLNISGVVFANDVVGATELKSTENKLIRHDLAVFPYPFAAIPSTEPKFIYLEVYDLFFDSEGRTNYEIEYQLIRKKKKRVSVSDTRQGNSRNEPIFLKLNFGQLKPDKYDLTVRIKDKIANLEKQSSLQIVLK